MPNIKTATQSFNVEQVRKLNPGETLESAKKSTSGNALDEVFFKYKGDTYLAVGEQLNVSALKGQTTAMVELTGNEGPVQVELLASDDEINSWSEGWAKGVSIGDSMSKAWSGMMARPDWSSVHRVSSTVGRLSPAPQAAPVKEPVQAPVNTNTTSVKDTVPLPPVEPPKAPTEGNPLIEVFFSKVHDKSSHMAPDNPDKKLAEFIRAADHTLDIAAFELDSPTIRDAILDAHSNGRKVRVVTDSNYVHEHDIQALKEAGIEVIDDQRSGLMHNKFVVADVNTPDAAVWTGSMNFTENGAHKNANNAIKIRSNALAQNFTAEFEEMFVDRRFGKTSPDGVQHPKVFVGGASIETYFAAEGNVAGKVAEALNAAEKSIHFMTFSFTHDAIGEVVAKKFNDPNVQVKGVFEKVGSGSKYSEYGALKKMGADVKVDANPNIKTMHHKVFIIDSKTVITGSFNFSQSADTSNDENLLIIQDESIAKAYEEEFQRLYATGN